MLKNTPTAFGSLAKWLHWTCSVLIIAMLVIGCLTTFLPNGAVRNSLFFYHKSIGVTLFALLLFRFLWRLGSVQPKHAGMARLQQVSAHITHYLLYLAVFVMILAGWGMSSWGGHPVAFWGIGNVAWPVMQNKALGHLGSVVHLWGAWILTGLIGMHVLAALYHHFIKKDHVLTGMLPKKNNSPYR